MPMIMHDEGDNVYRLEIHGTLRKIDFERCQNALLEMSTKLMCPWIHHW